MLNRVKKVELVLAHLHDLQDSQMEVTLLRSCLSLPNIAFALRTCPPLHLKAALSAFDDTMREALSDLVGVPLPFWSWDKATLPSSLGGLNIRQASLHAPVAFLGSIEKSKPLVSRILGHTPKTPVYLASTLAELAATAAKPEWASMSDIDVPIQQKALSHSIDEAIFGRLMVVAPGARFKALALSTSAAHAGDWLNVVPSQALGLHLHDIEFRLCLQYWLGVRIVEENIPCPICQVAADPFGDHQVGCGGNRDWIARLSQRCTLFSCSVSSFGAQERSARSDPWFFQ